VLWPVEREAEREPMEREAEREPSMEMVPTSFLGVQFIPGTTPRCGGPYMSCSFRGSFDGRRLTCLG